MKLIFSYVTMVPNESSLQEPKMSLFMFLPIETTWDDQGGGGGGQ